MSRGMRDSFAVVSIIAALVGLLFLAAGLATVNHYWG